MALDELVLDLERFHVGDAVGFVLGHAVEVAAVRVELQGADVFLVDGQLLD